MTGKKTRQMPTPHGDVTYETVTCTSCETEVPKADAERFFIGPIKSEYNYSYSLKKSKIKEGWACAYCRDEGPLGYPHAAHPNLPYWLFLAGALLGVIVGYLV